MRKNVNDTLEGVSELEGLQVVEVVKDSVVTYTCTIVAMRVAKRMEKIVKKDSRNSKEIIGIRPEQANSIETTIRTIFSTPNDETDKNVIIFIQENDIQSAESASIIQKRIGVVAREKNTTNSSTTTVTIKTTTAIPWVEGTTFGITPHHAPFNPQDLAKEIQKQASELQIANPMAEKIFIILGHTEQIDAFQKTYGAITDEYYAELGHNDAICITTSIAGEEGGLFLIEKRYTDYHSAKILNYGNPYKLLIKPVHDSMYFF